MDTAQDRLLILLVYAGCDHGDRKFIAVVWHRFTPYVSRSFQTAADHDSSRIKTVFLRIPYKFILPHRPDFVKNLLAHTAVFGNLTVIPDDICAA